MHSTPAILVTGANGQLGQELQTRTKNNTSYTFLFLDRTALDICDESAIQSCFLKYPIVAVINCAAYTQVDKAESDVEMAFAVNAKAVGLLAKACKESGSLLIHVSTDFVFNGESTIPYLETDETGPIGVYGKSKWEGEQLVREIQPRYLIIRTAWVYSSFGANFVKTMLRLGTSRSELNVVNDQLGRPTYAADLAQVIVSILPEIEKKEIAETYHYAGSGVVSWFDFATEIMLQANLDCQVHPIPTSGYPTPAKRPSYSALDTKKISADFKVEMRPWKESLQACIQLIHEKNNIL